MKKGTIRQKIRYWFDNLMSKGTRSLLLLLAVITIVVVIVISLILACILPEDFYSKCAEKIICGVKSLINRIIHSPALMVDPVSLA